VPAPSRDNGVVTHGNSDLKVTTNAPISPLIRPFQEFAAREASGGILLLFCTVAALIWMNSGLKELLAMATMWFLAGSLSAGSRKTVEKSRRLAHPGHTPAPAMPQFAGISGQTH
jgi:hypothetical protein